MERMHFSPTANRDPRPRLALLGGMSLAGSLIILAVTALAPPAQATHEPATEKQAAFQLVLERCYICHYLDRVDHKYAPSLKGIFQRRALTDGKPINDQTITQIIAEGSPNMPAFKHSLTPQQIQLIVKFLKEGWASEVPMLRNSR
ncbi:MAG: c-type cytochrome [Terriglobia bacterium]